jgi:hypothetical protein
VVVVVAADDGGADVRVVDWKSVSDDTPTPPETEVVEQEQPQNHPVIQISMSPEGLRVQSNGVLANPILSYGMLEAAKDVVRKMHEERTASPIVQARMIPPRGFLQ